MKILGWVDAYASPYKTESFTESHRAALIECIRKRHYNFNYNDMCFLPYGAPFFDTEKIALPSKAQFDEVMNAVYSTINRGVRLLPSDAIKRHPINEVLYEKSEYEPKGGEQ